MTDLIVIGKGPAGISAAVYALRAGKKVAVVAKDGGALEKTHLIENYYGFPEPISGKELLERGIAQAERLGAEIITDEIVDILYDGVFHLTGTVGTYEAPAVIFTMGSPRNKPKIEGIGEFEGRGVSYCAICDGFFFRKKRVAVLGNGEYALSEAKHLIPLAEKTYILTDGTAPAVDFPSETEIITDKVIKLEGENKLERVIFSDGKNLDIDGLFVAIGSAGSADFAKKLGVSIENNRISVNENRATDLSGLFAAGDCTPGLMQVAKAVSDGAIAGTQAVKFLNSLQKA